jgi:hypothetical protein
MAENRKRVFFVKTSGKEQPGRGLETLALFANLQACSSLTLGRKRTSAGNSNGLELTAPLL